MGRVLIHVPASLRHYWGGEPKVTVDARSLAEAIAALGPLATRVLDDTGAIRRHVQVFVNQGATSDVGRALADGDVIHILPAVSGGFQ